MYIVEFGGENWEVACGMYIGEFGGESWEERTAWKIQE
jgi:hypothetical protein